MTRTVRESPEETSVHIKLREELDEILREANDVLEQLELEIRETPPDGKRLQFTFSNWNTYKPPKMFQLEFSGHPGLTTCHF